MRKLMLLSLSILAHVACVNTQSQCEAASAFQPTLEVGVGQSSFQAIEDGDAVYLESGGQGSMHLWLALKATGIVPGHRPVGGSAQDTPSVHVYIEGTDGSVLVDDALWTPPFKGDVEQSVLVDTEVYPQYPSDAGDSGAVEADIHVEVTDVCGTTVSTVRRAMVTFW